jgi:hypothetical protein
MLVNFIEIYVNEFFKLNDFICRLLTIGSNNRFVAHQALAQTFKWSLSMVY